MRLKDENADLKRRLQDLEKKHKSSQIDNFEMSVRNSNNVISNNCSPFSHRLNPRALQRAEIEIEMLIGKP